MAQDSNSPAETKSQGENVLGLSTLVALVVANMVGAGVFTASGYALAALGTPGRVMLAWVACAIWALAGAIAYGSLARRLPESGGEYLFLARLVHPSIGFLAGWISVVAGFTMPIATAGLTAVLYAFPMIENGSLSQIYLASGLIVLVSLAHLVGVRVGTGIQNGIVGLKFLLLAAFVLWAMLGTDAELWQGSIKEGSLIPADRGQWVVLFGSMSWIALSYTGFNAAVYVAGDAKQARSKVPLAMVIATLIVTALYLALNTVFLFAPPKDAIVGQPAVATIAAGALNQRGIERLLQVGIVLSMVSSVFAMLLAGPRVYAKMAEDGVMPRVFSVTSGAVPIWATVAQVLLCLIAVFRADLLQLMTFLGLTLSACGALALTALFWVQRKLPDAKPLSWWELLSLIIHLGITVLILVAATQERPMEFYAMLITFGSGILVYGLWTWLSKATQPPTE